MFTHPRRPNVAAPLAIALASLFVAGCQDREAPTSPVVPPTASGAVHIIEGAGFVRVEGEVANGLFALIRPDAWNGELVVLLHGLVPITAPVSLQPPFAWQWNPFIEALLARGYGVAWSSYRANGLALEEAPIDTRIAQSRFTSTFGAPDRTWLVGWSMGAEVAQRLVETTPGRYAGFLSVCGGSGGRLQTDRSWNMRVVFDWFFPGVLPGNVVTSDIDYLVEGIPLVLPALLADIPSTLALASIDQLYVDWTSPDELVTGILAGLFIAGGSTQDAQEKAGGILFDNTETVYTSALLTPAQLAALNGGVLRVEGDPQALQWIERQNSPDGGMGDVRKLSLHTTLDPIVPLSLHGPAFQAIVDAAGTADQYVLRTVEGFGHCEFGFDALPDPFIDDQIAAFDDLVAWVDDGVTPSPDGG